MQHAQADDDYMTFADLVFPAFLFIVGMSIPIAIHARILKDERFWPLQGHVLIRTLGLLTLGFFMVNAESGHNESAMGMSIHLWSISFYIAAILVWNNYKTKRKYVAGLLRALGIAVLVLLAVRYRGGDGTQFMQPQWWGILGLIGWAYLYATVLFQLVRGKTRGVLALIPACIFLYILGHTYPQSDVIFLQWAAHEAVNLAHTAIVLSGIGLSLIIFNQPSINSLVRRVQLGAAFAAVLFAVGYFLRAHFGISKIHATPTWCLYSAATCIILFLLMYILTDVLGKTRWTKLFGPAASNPLLTYIIPFILWALYSYFEFYPLPASLRSGITAILFCILYAFAILWIVKGLNKLGIRLRL